MLRKPGVNPLLTASPLITEEASYFLTGNEYLSLPEIGPGVQIFSVNMLHLAENGLLEFRGTDNRPFLEPYIRINNSEVPLIKQLSWNYNLDWLPSFKGEVEGKLSLRGIIAAPPGYRGCCLRINLSNISSSAINLEAGWRGCWRSLNHIIFNGKEVKGGKKISYNQWTGSLILEGGCGLPLAALALALEPGGRWQVDGKEEAAFSGLTSIDLPPGKSAGINLYLAVNLEADGAGTTNVDLRRRGADDLIVEAENWLNEHRYKVEDKEISALMHRNLFFNYFYALGKALDDDSLIPVTSRSPRYYVSAAYWARDTLLWSFPALLLVSPQRARELLLTVFRRYLKRAGEHALYINGAPLYPGFELDQLAAHFLALEYYERFTKDLSLPLTGLIAGGLSDLVQKAAEKRDPDTGLYSTFLDPSDDPVQYPFLIYDNALLQQGFTYLAYLQSENRWEHSTDFVKAAADLRQSIYRHGIVKGTVGPMFAWAVNGKGNFQLYDNPPGSLQLLAYYGFCPLEDPVYKNTVAWIRSVNNVYFHQGCKFEEAGSLHCKNPWPLAACNDLLSFNTSGYDFLKRASMDNGFCCETVHAATGKVSSGAAFASAAGFLAHALWFGTARP